MASYRAIPAARSASVGTQLLGLFVLAVVFVGVFVGVGAVGDFRAARSAALADATRESRAQATSLSAYFAGDMRQTLHSLSSQPGVAGRSTAACSSGLSALRKLAPGSELAVLRADGSVFCSAGAPSLEDRASWVSSALRAGISIGAVTVDEATGQPQVLYGVTFHSPDGRRLLVLVTPSQGSLLDTSTTPLSLMVIDRESGLVLDRHATKSTGGSKVAARATSTLRSVGRGFTAAGPDGVERIYTTTPVKGTHWLVAAGISKAAAYAHARGDLRRNLALGAGLLVLLFGLGAVVYRRIVRPTRRLRVAIDRLAAAELATTHHVPEDGPRELAELGAAYNDMIDARARSEARLASLVRHASDLVFVVDMDGAITYTTPSVEELLGRPPGEVLGSVFLDLVDPDQRDEVRARLERIADSAQTHAALEFRLVHDNVAREVEARVQNLVADAAVSGLVVTCHDITDRKRVESELAHAAMHDGLTGLPNRALVLDRLDHLIRRVGRTGAASAVLFLDVDRFKLVNDSSGHAVGDELLVAVSQRLQQVIRPADTLGRFGGDEFVVVCEGLVGDDDATRVAARLLQVMEEPFHVDGQELFVTASIGIAPIRPGDEPGGVLQDADAALYRAKESGRARFAVFDDAMRSAAQQRLETGSSLRRAADGSGLYLDYQPLVDLGDGSVVGAEALLRWRREDGIIPPDAFIPVAEETGLIVPIGDWVIREACRQFVSWQQESRFPVDAHVSVNVSARQVTQRDFVEGVSSAIADTGIDPEHLVLELTESVLMADEEWATAVMSRLRHLGVRMSIDDFGTGYSSLGYLQRLPIDELKIDRRFVAPLSRGGAARAIVDSVVDLAHAVGLRVVAEGVEEAGQLDTLTEIGCDLAQGFYFARPGSPDAALEAFLSRPAPVLATLSR